MIALSTGCSFNAMKVVFVALILGFFSYGISIMMFIYAMRGLGAARASAFFSSAPFIGTMISLILFREWPSINFILSLPVMIVGSIFIFMEKHMHAHKHGTFNHEHKHVHNDGHHNHQHIRNGNKEHTHLHVHEAMKHEHFHTPDIHHRHAH